MTDFLNPLGGRFLGRSGPVAPTTINGTIPDPPRGFLQLDPGTIIKGVVMGRENDGLVTIATDKGTVRVASSAPLPPGTHVTLEVRPTGDRLQVLILASDAVRTGAPGQQQLLTPTANPSIPTPPSDTPTTTSTAPVSTAASGTSPSGTPAAGTQPTHTAPPPATNQPPPPATTTPIQIVGSTLPAIVLQPQSVAPQIPPPAVVPNTPAPSTPTPPAPPVSAPPTSAAPTTPPLPITPPTSTSPTTPPASSPATSTPATSTPPAGLPPASAPPTSAPTTSVPPTTTPPASAPPVAAPPTNMPLPTTPLPGTSPMTTTPTMAPPPQFQIQLPNGQIVTLPVTTTTPTVVPPPQPALPIQAQPVQIQPVPPPGAAPAPVIPATLPLPGEPAAIARPPMITPPPAASTLSGDVQQRILALFTATPTPAVAPVLPMGHTAPLLAAVPQLPPGAELQLRVLAVQIGNQHPIEIDPAAQLRQGGKESHIVFGRVIAVTPAGHAVIHTPVGNILLQQHSTLPVGAQLALAIDTVEAPPVAPVVAAPVAVQTPQQALLSLSRTWPTLADLIAILQGGAPHAAGKGGIDPALSRDLLAHLPQMGSRLGAGMMAGIAAFRSGDIGRLLGPLFAARGLGPEREEMVRRLRGEFTQLSSLAQDRPEAEWRALFLPYLDDQQRVQRINLYYRRHRRGETGQEDGDGGTRFVVEADFTRLGPFQLDGLMRQQRFDLMIRSHLRLDERMRRDIEAIYEEARGLTGFSGAIAFQTVDEFPVAPLEELKQQADKVSV